MIRLDIDSGWVSTSWIGGLLVQPRESTPEKNRNYGCEKKRERHRRLSGESATVKTA